MKKLWLSWKARHWDEHFRTDFSDLSWWEGDGRIGPPPLRRAARWAKLKFTEPKAIEWIGVVVAVIGLIRCS